MIEKWMPFHFSNIVDSGTNATNGGEKSGIFSNDLPFRWFFFQETFDQIHRRW